MFLSVLLQFQLLITPLVSWNISLHASCVPFAMQEAHVCVTTRGHNQWISLSEGLYPRRGETMPYFRPDHHSPWGILCCPNICFLPLPLYCIAISICESCLYSISLLTSVHGYPSVKVIATQIIWSSQTGRPLRNIHCSYVNETFPFYVDCFLSPMTDKTYLTWLYE